MKHRTHPAAEQEAEDAAEWYAARSPALGIEFARQYALAVDWIIDRPQMYPLAEDGPPGSNVGTWSGSAASHTGSFTPSSVTRSTSSPSPTTTASPPTGKTALIRE